ncbi:hypothetical protein MMC30_004584 [Trapelia coarctata]|nr:hypothetical protein [Trapelia coarctata]
MSYEYGPLPAPQYIRLLRISCTSSQIIQASVKIINLDDSAQYKCLSYTWDGGKFDNVGEKWSTPNITVLLDGQPVLIRQNLHDALDHLRLLDVYGPIWIDAICINQADIAERNSQVAQMSRIYENAQEVIVWLGKEEAYSASAIKSMQRLKFTMDDMFTDSQSSPSTTLPPWERDFIECRFSDKELVGMIDFCVSYRWFSRIWTVQELILARKLMFVCGTIIEPLDTIWRGSFMSNFLGFASSWDRLHSTEELQWALDFGAVGVSEYMRRRLNETPSSIGLRAHRFRNRQATDPRDKVFGIANISRTSDRLVESGPFVIDYTKTVQAVYIEASVFALVAFKGLEALSYVGDRTTNQVHDLPSWVPDFSQKLTVKPFQVALKKFSTTSNFETLIWFITGHPQAVILSGIHFDTVTATSSAHWPVGEKEHVNGISSLYNLVLNPQPVTSTAREEVHTILWRTLIADGYHAYNMDPQFDLEAAFDRWLFCRTCDAVVGCDIQLATSFFTNVEDNLAKVMETLGISGSIEHFKGSLLRGRSQCDTWEKVVMGAEGRAPNLTHAHYRDPIKDEYSKQWGFAGQKRCIFRTERGYLGLGLGTLRARDRIYILQGAPVPYIFRHRDIDPDDVLDLEGEAYVHGIMYGEAVGTGNLNFQKITVY